MWFVPTRGRPERCQQLLDSIVKVGCSTPGVIIVDRDDDAAYAHLRLPANWRLRIHTDHLGLLGTLNAAFEEFPNEPWYGFLNDDFIVHTEGWDRRLIKAAGSRGMANSDDGWQKERRMCGALVFGGELLRAWGWWAPPGLWHCYADNIWEMIGKWVDNWRYVGDVLVEHKHHMNNKAAEDKTYREGYERFAADEKVFQEFCKKELPAAKMRTRSLFAAEIKRGENRVEKARSKRLMIATPIARDPATQYTLSLYKTGLELQQLGIVLKLQTVLGSSNLPRARNELVANFLASDCSDLLFIDDNMAWEPQSVVRLLASDHPVIGAAGRKRVDKPNTDIGVWCANLMTGAESKLNSDYDGNVEVMRVGTAFLKISRTALEILIAANPDWKRSGRDDMAPKVRENYYRFFAFDENDELGEDFVFCDRWRGEGGQVWIDPSIELGHVGTKEYAGAIAELMSTQRPEAEAAA